MQIPGRSIVCFFAPSEILEANCCPLTKILNQSLKVGRHFEPSRWLEIWIPQNEYVKAMQKSSNVLVGQNLLAFWPFFIASYIFFPSGLRGWCPFSCSLLQPPSNQT
jgi:hypothetical protein